MILNILNIGTPIGAQDNNQSSEGWRSGFQDAGNEFAIYIALFSTTHHSAPVATHSYGLHALE
jgi:hypothetical protein